MRARFKGESISPPRSKIIAGGGRSMEKVLCDHGMFIARGGVYAVCNYLHKISALLNDRRKV